MTPERAQQLYEAIELLREISKVVALVKPELDIVAAPVGTAAGLVVAAEPVIEAALSAIFEAVSALEQHGTPEAARDALAAQIRANAQASLDARFPNG